MRWNSCRRAVEIVLLVLAAFYFPFVTYGQKAEKKVMIVVEDSVRKIEKIDGGYDVFFNTNAGIYSLRESSHGYAEVLKILKKSERSGEKVKLEANSTTLEIANLK